MRHSDAQKRVRLHPSYQVLWLAPDWLVFRSEIRIVHFRNPIITPVFELLLRNLYGELTVSEIIEKTSAKSALVEACLDLLQNHGLLEDISSAEALSSLRLTSSISSFLAEMTGCSVPLELEHERRIWVLSLGYPLESLIRDLSRYDISGFITDLSGSLSELPQGWKCLPTPSDLNEYDHFPDVQLVVTLLDRVWHPFLKQINKLILETNTRWFPILIQGRHAILGPTVIPHKSACYTCFDLRQRGNLREIEVYNALCNAQSINQLPPCPISFTPFVDAVIGQVMLEIIKLVSGSFSPQTLGRVIEIDLETSSPTSQAVLKLPRCPTCGISQPSMLPWDTSISWEVGDESR